MPELHDYQRRAVKHLHNNPHAGLFLDMGLGKTAITLSAITPEHLPVIAIAPKRVAENVWQAERDKWRPDLSIAIAAGGPAKRAAAIDSGADITVIGRDNIKDVPSGKYETIILDELSGFKSRGSQRWKTARKLTGPAPYVWGLTGTPTPNGLMDLWAQMFLLDRGSRLEDGIDKYRNRYFTAGWIVPNTHVVARWDLKPGAEKAIHRRIDDICLSMSAADYLIMPPVTYNDVIVPLPPKAMRIYAELKEELTVSVDMLGDVTAANAAVLSNKLSQISAGFLYDDEDKSKHESIHDEKINALHEIIDGTGSPVLVFYRYRRELEQIKAQIPKAVSIDEPRAMAAWNAGEVPVLLAHPASAGHGLNLQSGGHTIVWTTLDWSLELYQQANARLIRQGQHHPVIVHHLLAEKTIDSYILKRLGGKATVQDALLAHLEEII